MTSYPNTRRTRATAASSSPACAAIAAGADGLLIEMHPNPERALSDGAQSLFPEQFERTMREITAIAEVIGRGVVTHAGAAA